MRDAVSLLDQMTSYGATSATEDSPGNLWSKSNRCWACCYRYPRGLQFVEALAAKDVSAGLQLSMTSFCRAAV